MFIDDELGGCSDDDFAPITLLDEDHEEALLDNEDGEDEVDNVEELAQDGAGDVTKTFRFVFCKIQTT